MEQNTRIAAVLAVFSLVLSSLAWAENVYRWRDENGKVHYGATLPPEYANSPYEVLNSQGVVIEEVTDPLAKQKAPAKNQKSAKPEPLFTEDEVRMRSDRLLMLRYHSEDDIRDAMEVEVAQLGYDARLINQTMTSAMTSLAGQVKNAADRQRAGMPVAEETETSINKLRQRIRNNERSLAALKTREKNIRATFEKELERYRYLENGGTPGQFQKAESPDPEADTGD